MANLERKIGQLRTKLRAYYAGDGTGRLVAFVSAFALASFACDYLFHLPIGVRAVLLAGFFTGAAAVVWRQLVRPLGTSMSDDDMVLFYESAYPDSKHRLISALQLRRAVDAPDYPFSRQLTNTVIEEGERYAEQLDSSRLGATPEMRKRIATGGGLAAVVFLAAFAAGLASVRFLLRYVATHDFRPFAWYRFAAAAAVFWL